MADVVVKESSSSSSSPGPSGDLRFCVDGRALGLLGSLLAVKAPFMAGAGGGLPTAGVTGVLLIGATFFLLV